MNKKFLYILIAIVGVGGVVTAAMVLHQETTEKKVSRTEGVIENKEGEEYVESGELTAPMETPTDTVNLATVVRINTAVLTEEELQDFHDNYGMKPKAGAYWYDVRSGAFGVVGQGTVSFMEPGHNFGPLSRNASNGTTGVLVNGREITSIEFSFLQGLVGAIPAGAYWLEANGNYGIEGNTTALGNLRAVAEASGGTGDNFWSTGQYSGGNYNADNSQGYVNVPGYGAVDYGF